MTDKRYNVETLNDIIKFINTENKKRFLEDFSQWLDRAIKIKKIVHALPAKSYSIKVTKFIWIDDGKGTETINIKFTKN